MRGMGLQEKERQKRLKNTGNIFKKNLQLVKRCLLILGQRKVFYRPIISVLVVLNESSCAQ